MIYHTIWDKCEYKIHNFLIELKENFYELMKHTIMKGLLKNTPWWNTAVHRYVQKAYIANSSLPREGENWSWEMS